MKEKLRELYNDYIGWLVIIAIIFPLGIILDVKFIEMLKKLKDK